MKTKVKSILSIQNLLHKDKLNCHVIGLHPFLMLSKDK
jgi:hypothetical protein